MSGNVDPNSGPVFPCLVCARNVTGGLGQCNATTAPNGSIKSAHYSSSPNSELLAALTLGAALCFFWRQHCDFFLGLFQLIYSYCSIRPPLPVQHFRPTLTLKPLIPFRSLRIFSLCTLTTASCSWLSLYTSCFVSPSPNSLRVFQ